MNRYSLLILAILYLLCCNSFASSEHHDHDHHNHNEHEEDEFEFTDHQAHEHGHANTKVSYSNNQLAMTVTLPAIDVFGFEHKASNEQQQEVIDTALNNLSTIENIVVIHPSCTTERYKVNRSQQDLHADVIVDMLLKCVNAEPLEITFNVFDILPTIDKMTVEYISDNKQELHTLTSNENHITAN